MNQWRVLDLFSGIGGFSLGLERAGMTTVAFCEIEPYCRAVLAKHWPGVPIYDDVRELTAVRLRADGIGVDVICGGFPCQDISIAGKGAGIEGGRSGLWREYARLVGELGPSWVVIENVAALRSRGADRVFDDLEAIGYTGQAFVVGADDVGAPHRRKRVWIVAYPQREQLRQQSGRGGGPGGAGIGPVESALEAPQRNNTVRFREVVADAHGTRLAIAGNAGGISRPDSPRLLATAAGGSWWAVEPDVGRVAHGVPARVDRLKCLGNAVVPQINEAIGRAIMRAAA